ncbi:ABC transporter permease [Alkalicoccus daliensis]|uniref:Putative spermidine/putrescine transport system permease protein n=1 Tax=Alkalicoccus daliensis TaxID=745820 RepID=A0A1H0K8X4_9BACI|nr:ABC transporter permease subunit [Alkalicoccus daliensis]SDO52253.1 putative spermidine/putrescine transport system permease protein [Alkalicoccus daliensis]
MRKKWTKILLSSLLFFLFIFPVLFLFFKSITFGWNWPDILPHTLNLRAWTVIFNDPLIYRSLFTTVFIGVVVVILNYLIALPAAYALSHGNPRGKTLIETILLLPILVPVLAIAMGLHLVMIRLGIADNTAGVILIHLLPTLPYAVRVLKAGFDRISPDWVKQSRTIGTSQAAAFFIVLLPMMLPSIRSAGILVFVISLSQYVLTAIIGGGQVTTLPLLYYPFFNSANEAVVAGFSVLFAALPILFLILMESSIYLYKQWLHRL